MGFDLLELFNLNLILMSHPFSVIKLKEVSNLLVRISLKHVLILLLIQQTEFRAPYNCSLIHDPHCITHLLVAIIPVFWNS